VFVLQYKSGVYQSELSHQPDESAHVVTSLMIHDYAKTGIGTSPLQFAENYYVHYPKVAFGIWPPVFHSTAALWMFLFTRTHTSLLIFIALQGAACAAILAMFARRLLSSYAAFCLGLFMILLPAVQDAYSLMMVDLFLTIMQLCAMLLMIALFRDGSMKSAVWFGILTSLAMLTKGNANALLLSGVFMLLLTRQFSILKRLPVYVAGAIILVLGMPWQVVTLRFFKGSVPMDPLTLSRFWMLFKGYTAMFVDKLSLPLFLFALVGLAAECLPMLLGRRKESPADPHALDIAGAASLLVAIFLFHCVAPNPGPDDRYILPALPLLLLFSALGIRRVATMIQVPQIPLAARAGILAVLCLGWFAKTTFRFTGRPEMGFSKTAAGLLPGRVSDEVVLVCSDAWGEGAFITSMALGDRLGDEHIVLRGSKALSENPWDITTYHPFYQNSAELEAYLEQVPVDAVVVDYSRTLWEQDRELLKQTILGNPAKWALTSEIQETGDRRHLQLYRWIGPDHSSLHKNVRVRMHYTLGHDLQLK
jgi:hypothetical protein